MWGWPGSPVVSMSQVTVFPTGVGMARNHRWADSQGKSVPHGCGDGPFRITGGLAKPTCSPRVWGWPAGIAFSLCSILVFPTGVGMAR